LRLGVHDPLDDAEQVEGRPREAVGPRHRHHVAGSQLVEHAEKLAPVGPRACHLLPVDVPACASGGAKLLKLTVEGLPHGANAGIADAAVFGGDRALVFNFVPVISYGNRKPLKGKALDF
jgi:hypothetical protein